MLDFSFSSKQKMTAFYLGYFKAKMVVGIFLVNVLFLYGVSALFVKERIGAGGGQKKTAPKWIR